MLTTTDRLGAMLLSLGTEGSRNIMVFVNNLPTQRRLILEAIGSGLDHK